RGPEVGWLLAQLEIEHDNLRAALDWAEETAAATAGRRLAARLGRFWQLRGYLAEGRERLARLLGLPDAPMGSPEDRAARAAAVAGAGSLADAVGDYPAARALAEQALAIWRQLKYAPGIADCLNDLDGVALATGDYDAARECFEGSLAIRRG